MASNDYICLDTEFVNNQAIIELSVFNIAGEEIYHELYRPDKRVRWTAPPDKLKITPEMLEGKPTFPERREAVQKIIDRCSCIIGYAIDNDISMLRKCGIQGLDTKRIVEVRELFWYVVGRSQGMDLNSVPRLTACTNELGMEFSDGEAHFASSDTRATLFCFHTLLERYAHDKGLEGFDKDNPAEILDMFNADFAMARDAFLRERASGYVCLFPVENAMKMKVLREKPADDAGALLTVWVADRALAELEITKRFERKIVGGSHSTLRLNDKDMQYIKRYKNDYDEERSRTARKLMKLRHKYPD